MNGGDAAWRGKAEVGVDGKGLQQLAEGVCVKVGYADN